MWTTAREMPPHQLSRQGVVIRVRPPFFVQKMGAGRESRPPDDLVDAVASPERSSTYLYQYYKNKASAGGGT